MKNGDPHEMGRKKGIVYVWIALKRAASAFSLLFFSFFFLQPQLLTSLLWTVHKCTVHGSHKLHFLSAFSLKMGPTIPFIHLKIILLQCFQFSVFSFSKISSIQTDPKMTKLKVRGLKWKRLKVKSLFGQQNLVTQFSSLNFYHSSLNFSHLFAFITQIPSLTIFHTIWRAHVYHGAAFFFFFL